MNTQTLKGFRDFLPAEKLRRNWVQQKIVAAFELSGFLPLETPTLEYKEVIMGKYGEEADKLVYEFVDNGGREVALRYDQTVPLSRVVAENRFNIALPFRRYQIQNVFRADKPQKGRYREFTQCDIDIVGSASPLADAEILATTYQAFVNLGFTEVELRVNDRQVLLSTLSPFATDEVSVLQIIQSIDKLDKMTPADVSAELVDKGLSKESADAALEAVKQAQKSKNLAEIFSIAESLGVPAKALVFSPAIARGLDYYTGMIFEIVAPSFSSGSLGGGGRYDNLLNDLGGVDLPAVGVGLGFDRIVEAVDSLNLIVEDDILGAGVLVTVFAEEQQSISAAVTQQFRQAGISTELFNSTEKLAKQFKYANKLSIPWVVVVGPEEAEKGMVQLKNMTSGEQVTVSVDEAIATVQK
ncbi:histidine--tRNA ligase [Candidatus Woesebacteria bacterium]|nr:histidine--tRNA ligase [Candidatus Woesebacteria bacterium]MCD8506878.1 histidine--tRNA ligase [Candidatus Woesebacteria bacterium]MCD8527502.1 histidine--tRNA ligase [Candidatus Woesebacteria bacterium]MCD8546243.1 histidine--tRNA ligase [Candidatus Woesebacteria bacterium]